MYLFYFTFTHYLACNYLCDEFNCIRSEGKMDAFIFDPLFVYDYLHFFCPQLLVKRDDDNRTPARAPAISHPISRF